MQLVEQRSFLVRAIGSALVALGGLLLLSTIGYVGLGIYGEARLDELVVPEDQAPLKIEDLQRDLFVPGLAPVTGAARGATSDRASAGSTEGSPSLDDTTTNSPSGVASSLDTDLAPAVGDGPSEASITGLTPTRLGDGFEFGPSRSEATDASTGSTIGARFEPVDWAELPLSIGARPRAERMIIPAIGLDSTIVELGTRWDGPNRQWETADSAVGHHLGTPNPMELGNSVFSGHINSPFRGEGSIFRRLPEVAGLLREGRTVDIILESESGRYLYRATSSDVLLPEDVKVFRPDRTPSLTLITCVPATHYTHRFLVNAVLVGYAPA